MPGNTFDEVDTQGVLIERGDVPSFMFNHTEIFVLQLPQYPV